MTLKEIQAEHKEWADHNFGKHPSWHPLLGAMEELGELAHSHLKQEQGIRNKEDHVENAKDAVADVIIYLIDYCNCRDFDMQELLTKAWNEVKRRDWKKNPDDAYKTSVP